MYNIRCTQPLLKKLAPAPSDKGNAPEPTTRLGDWYANRLNIGHTRLVLCTSERSLLSVVVPTKNLPGLPERLAASLEALLRSFDVSDERIVEELREMSCARFDRTASRSVLGSMRDFSLGVRARVSHWGWPGSLSEFDRELAETPCGPLDYEFPIEVSRQLLLDTATRKVRKRMEFYEPLQGPDSDEWFALDERERVILVEEYHESEEVNLPNLRIHASFHAVVENQIASGDPPEVLVTLERLLREGLNRHEAIHAIGSVLSEQIFNVMKNPSAQTNPNKAYIRRLKKLTAMMWLSSGH